MGGWVGAGWGVGGGHGVVVGDRHDLGGHAHLRAPRVHPRPVHPLHLAKVAAQVHERLRLQVAEATHQQQARAALPRRGQSGAKGGVQGLLRARGADEAALEAGRCARDGLESQRRHGGPQGRGGS